MKNSVKSILFTSAIAAVTILSCKKEDNVPSTHPANTQVTDMPCLPSSLASTVMAFYPFSNGSLNDFSGNGHHLTNSTTAHAAVDRNGNPTCAFEFTNDSSTAEFLTSTNTTFLNGLTQFSVSLWYQPLDSTRNGTDFEVLISRGDIGSCPDRRGDWSVSLYDCRKAVFGRQNSVWDNNIQNSGCSQEVAIRTGSWHHLVATFNQTSNTMSIYRDGILQQTGPGAVDCGSGIPTIQNIGDLLLGKYYTGRLDDVILLHIALNQTQINQLYSMGACCSN
jgi:hypothetical protein